MLGIGLPSVGVTTAAAYKNVPPPKRRGDADGDQPNQPRPLGYEGILHPTPGYVAEPLVGNTEGVLGDDALLAIPIETIPGAMNADSGVLLTSLKKGYGPTPRLEVLDGLHMVWAGTVQMHELEMPAGYTGNALLLLKAMLPSAEA